MRDAVSLRESLLAHVKEVYGIAPDFPWADENAVLRRADNGKWFGVLMRVSRARLGLCDDGMVDVLNIKCEPAAGAALRMEDGILPAYHMNKVHWISVLLDGTVEAAEVRFLLAESYHSVAPHVRRLRGGK